MHQSRRAPICLLLVIQSKRFVYFHNFRAVRDYKILSHYFISSHALSNLIICGAPATTISITPTVSAQTNVHHAITHGAVITPGSRLPPLPSSLRTQWYVNSLFLSCRHSYYFIRTVGGSFTPSGFTTAPSSLCTHSAPPQRCWYVEILSISPTINIVNSIRIFR